MFTAKLSDRRSSEILTDARKPTWSLPQYLALTGVLFLLWEAWTVVAWLGDHPHQITTGRVHSGVPFWGAHAFEAVLGVVSIAYAVHLVRRFRREGQLSFFHKLSIALFFSMWLDSLSNIFFPVFLYSDQLVNTNYALGHAPFIVNKHAMNLLPWPWLSDGMIYVCLIPGTALVGSRLMTSIRAKHPSLSVAKIVIFVGLPIGFLLDLAMEIPMHLAELWAQPGMPTGLELFGGKYYSFSLLEMGITGGWLAVWVLIAYFVDDRGHTFMDRGLERYSAKVRYVTAQLSMIGLASLAIVGGNIVFGLPGFYAPPWPGGAPPSLGSPLCVYPQPQGQCVTTPGFQGFHLRLKSPAAP